MKKLMISLLLALASTPALTGEAAGIDKLDSCAQLQDTQQRLACFDREYAALRTKKVAPATAPMPAAPKPAPPTPAPVAAPTPVPAPRPSSSASFGQDSLAAKARPPSAPTEEPLLHARIAALRAIDPDTALMTLDNGQVWRYETRYLATALREGEAVTLRKAALGSYRLTRDVGDAKNWIRATRVR